MKKKLLIALTIVFILSAFALCVSAEGEPVEETPAEPTSNIYDIIKDCWNYILPEQVITDNQNIINLYTIKAVSIVVLAPLALIFVVLPLCIIFKRR